MNGDTERHSSVLERDLRHFREMAKQTAGDPALAAETTLWEALAAQVDEYLRPDDGDEPDDKQTTFDFEE